MPRIIAPALALTALAFLMAAPARAEDAPPSPHEMLTASDRVRNPDQPFRLTNTLVEYIAGKPRDRVVLVIFGREDKESGKFSNLVRYADPPRDAGKLVLLNGSNLWFYDPASKASIRISPQQRLI